MIQLQIIHFDFFKFRCNFSDMEIEMFFCRYDNDGNFTFGAEGLKKFFIYYNKALNFNPIFDPGFNPKS